MLFILFFEVYAVVTENVCCCRQEQPRSRWEDVQHYLPIAPSCSMRNFKGTRGGSDTGISETGLASLPASLPLLIPLLHNWSCTCTSGAGVIRPNNLRHRACKYLLIYIFKVILCCKFTWYVVCHKTKTFYCNVIKKFVLLRSKYIIAVFCGLFKGFYLVVQ